jgi:hypothetical protein
MDLQFYFFFFCLNIQDVSYQFQLTSDTYQIFSINLENELFVKLVEKTFHKFLIVS